MKRLKKPLLQQGGTAKRLYSRKERARRERIVVEQLEELSVTDPDGFASMLKLLAKMVAKCEAKEN